MNTCKVAIITLMVSVISIGAQAQLGGALKKAKEKAGGQTESNSTFDGSKVQPDACISNVEGRLKSINDSYYPKYKNDPKGYLASSGALWFPRKDFEAARYYFTGGLQGYGSPGRVVCETGAATADPRYIALKPKMDEAEAKVKEMEKAKGVEFVGVRDNSIIFKDLKTGKEIDSDQI